MNIFIGAVLMLILQFYSKLSLYLIMYYMIYWEYFQLKVQVRKDRIKFQNSVGV